MPSTMTHAFMAMDIFERLNKKNIFKKEKLNEYITYSQGPDILFFYKIFFPLKKNIRIQRLGNKFQREKTNQLFISLVKQIKKTQDQDQFLFLAGLTTHYIGDTTCHPLVNYKAQMLKNKTKKNKDYHFLIESYIDSYILNLKEDNYQKFPIYKFFSINTYKSIQDLLTKSYRDVFLEENIGNIYYESLKYMKIFFRLVRYDPYKIKRIIYTILSGNGIFFKRDIRYLSYNFSLSKKENDFYLNLDHAFWYNIKKKENTSNKTFLELYDEVIDKSLRVIEQLYNYIYHDKDIDLDKLFGNLSYANGLPIEK